MIHNIQQRGKTAIVIEAAFGMCPQTVERSGAIPTVRRAIGLKIVNADIRSQVHVPSRLGRQRLDMATAALAFAIENFFAARGSRMIKASFWRRRSRQRELIEMQSRQLGRDLVIGIGYVPKSRLAATGNFAGSSSRGSKKLPLPCISRLATNAFQ